MIKLSKFSNFKFSNGQRAECLNKLHPSIGHTNYKFHQEFMADVLNSIFVNIVHLCSFCLTSYLHEIPLLFSFISHESSSNNLI